MDIDHAPFPLGDKGRAEHAHVAGEDDEFWTEFLQKFGQSGFVFFTAEALGGEVMEGKVKPFHQPGEVGVVANDSDQVEVDFPEGVPDKKVGGAMMFTGDQHNGAARAEFMQLEGGPGEVQAVKVLQEAGIVSLAFEFGAHKEAAGVGIYVFLIFHQVPSGAKEHAADFVD
ncbi:MAG: hypothetical protein OHK005_16780 [Candidatus Methylacidiphilales bacterium]